MKAREVLRLIEGHGWRRLRTRGDHHIFEKDGEVRCFASVPQRDWAGHSLRRRLEQFGIRLGGRGRMA